MLHAYFADMHIHIGRDIYGQPVKITASKTLTLTNILKEASRRKGIHMIGVIDCHAPAVQEEIQQLIDAKKAHALEDGGIRFEKVTLLLGAEIEIYDETCEGPIHVLCYFPTLKNIRLFTDWLKDKMTNISLSSQRYYGTAKALQYKIKELSGLFIPAHIFTPFKGMYGKGVKQSLSEVFDPSLIDGIELGLSSNTSMASRIHELTPYTFLSNSDAHSLAKIAREYQEILMEKPSFKEFEWALNEIQGRKIKRNFGMNPLLGKYYTTVCGHCLNHLSTETTKCPACGQTKVIKGVADRINELIEGQSADPVLKQRERPPYLHQVPLEYLPTLGPKTFEKLLNEFQTEMNVIHEVPYQALREVVPEKLAKKIIDMRDGKLEIKAGGGGKYGKIKERKN